MTKLIDCPGSGCERKIPEPGPGDVIHCYCGQIVQGPPAPPATPITEEWLKANGWKLESSRNDPNHRNPGFRIRPVAPDCLGWRRPFQSHDDLCIGVAPVHGDEGEWHVWVYQIEPYRHIHVRHMRYVWELVKLWEGLTGRTATGDSLPSQG